MMYKIFLRFPDALRPAFPRIKDKLAEDDPSTCPWEPAVSSARARAPH